MIFTLVVGDVGGVFCGVVAVVVDADRLVFNCAKIYFNWVHTDEPDFHIH